MALVVKDRVRETTTTTGTGTLTLSGAVTGFQSFSSALSDGDTTYYGISEGSTGNWEVGLGTFTSSGTTLARTTVLASSSSGSAINLTATADVFITQPAGKATYFDASGDLILNQDPTSNLQAATKQYVDTIAAAGLHYHDPVRVEQEGNLNATYDNGTSGVGATLTNAGTQAALVIDGVTMVLNDRVLIYEQTNAAHNGVYTVTNVGSASTNWVLTRATDADSYGPSDPDALGQGDAFFVQEGAAGAGETYVMTTEGTITFGTTDITFSQVSATQIYSAGNGLTLTGTTFAAGAGTGVTVNANDIAIGQDVGTTADVTFNSVSASLTGNVTGDVTGDLTGNADTATTWATSRTVSLTGDVTGSATGVDGSGNVSIATTIAADSVALGTDTTGNYVQQGATSGNGISGSVNSEGGTFTVTSNATSANTASTTVFRDASGNFSAGTITATLNGNASTATSATNADTVDSLHASQFLRSDTADTTSGNLTIATSGTSTFTVETTASQGQDALIKIAGARTSSSTSDIGMVEFVNDTSSSYTLAQISAMDPSGAHDSGNGKLVFRTSSGGTLSDKLVIPNTGDLTYDGNEVWHAGNDGSGSGLDADLWDGNQFSSYLNQAVLTTSSPGFSNAYLAGSLYHSGDTDTRLLFGTNTITLQTGGSSEITVNTTGVRLGDTGNGYFQPVTGSYGSIQIDGGAHGGWEGYSIGGRVVFMHDNSSGSGLFNDVNDEWMVYCALNGAVNLYYNGSAKLDTLSNGVSINGNLYTDGSNAEDWDSLSGTSPTCNVDNAGAFSLTMTGNTTFTFSGADSGWSMGFVLQLTGNGSTVTWPSSVDWAGGTAPDAPASGETDIYVFWTRDGGTTWYGALAIDAAA